ncbi:uncharacterized protein EI90DRAFT_537263 [Cantharellus anzutake]|uniref:uncharacterized protein n=1 Tax=Cantharellus anzutake TaxID=1750568 RepID=UPI001902DAF5|nr:uncharacterized protein EI90DRAFT_537263 [Cantharellus anzutake]KAF8334322.1 hypothetical protein EI90DRAFT_537263 [Cantharellus anzutake]
MPPKRKRNAESDTQSIAPSTRSTRASTRATTASEANNEVVAAKKPRMTRKASTKKPAVSQSSEDEPNGDVEASPKKRRGKTATVTKSAANKKSAAPSKPVDPLQPGTYTKERALELFKKYAENEDDVEPGAEPNISPDGVMSLYQDANVSLEGVQPLIFSWICKSNAMGSIKQNEWMEGMGTLQEVIHGA